MLFLLLHVLLLLSLVDAGHPSAPEDLFAFPRYSVAFLNGLPVDNHTAQKWLSHGLNGGLAEFLGQSPPESIESGDHPLVQSNKVCRRRDILPPATNCPRKYATNSRFHRSSSRMTHFHHSNICGWARTKHLFATTHLPHLRRHQFRKTLRHLRQLREHGSNLPP